MKEIPYKKLVEEYIPWVESNVTGSFDPKTTNTHTSELSQSEAIDLPAIPDFLNPDPNLSPTIRDVNPNAEYNPKHTASNGFWEQGWTEKQYAEDDNAGGFIRTVILSGSYAELRKVRVDSELNSETISTSWSASIGENLKVGNNVGIAGYIQVGETGGLKQGATEKEQEIIPSTGAPNSEGIDGLRLVVSNSALIQEDHNVKKSASVSGNLDVYGTASVTGSLHVSASIYGSEDFLLTGSAYITGNVQVVGDEAITGSLHVSKSIYGSENFYLTGNAEVTGNVQVVGDEAITGSLHVSESIYGSEDLYLSGNAEISKSLYVSESLVVTGSVHFSNSLYVSGNEYVSGNVYISGNTEISSGLKVDGRTELENGLFVSGGVTSSGNLIVSGDAYITNSIFVGNGGTITGSLLISSSDEYSLVVAGSSSFDDVVIDGTLVVRSGSTFEGDLYVYGNEFISDNIYVTGSTYISQNLEVEGNTSVAGNSDVTGNVIVGGDVWVDQDVDVLGDIRVDGNISASNSGSFQDLLVAGNSYLSGNVVIAQDLIVQGTASYINTQDLYVKDPTIVIACGSANPAEADGAGIEIDGANVSFHYNASNDRMVLNKGLEVEGDQIVSGDQIISGNQIVSGNQSVEGSVDVTGSLEVREYVLFRDNLKVEGSASIGEGLIVSGNVDINSSHFVMEGASIISGTMNVDNSVNTTDLSASNNTSTKYLYVDNSASIHIARVTESYVTNEVVTQSLVLTQSVSQSNVYQQIVTQSTVLTQSVSQSTVLSQSVTNQNVTTQSVVSQSVTSSNITNLTVVTESVQNISIVSGNADYLQVDKLVINSTESAQFGGDVIVNGNVSASNSGSFKDLYVENNATIGHTASVGQLLEIEGDGKGNSVTVETGSIYAPKSDLTVQNISSSNIYASGMVTAEYFYGDGRYLTGVTASAASSSTWKQYIDIAAGGTERFIHPFNTTDVFVQVYQWDNPDFHPSTSSVFDSPATRVNDAVVKIIDRRVVDVTYDRPLNGYIVISDAGMMITGEVDLLQVATDTASFSIPSGSEKTIYRFEHKLGTRNVIVSVYQNTDIKDGRGTIAPVQVFPEQISIADQNHIDIVFGRAPMEGYIVIAKAGHVIKQFDIAGAIEDWGIHYGTTGSWAAKQFTAETLSADAVIAHEYVDTPRVGVRDTGTQYYYERTWGSYIEFADNQIDAYISNSNIESEPVKHVASLDSAGNLKIAGNIETNAVFTTSDIRKKNVEGPIENALESLEGINGVRFTWKDSGEPSIGVIAQEIKAIYPELTKTVVNSEGEEQLVVNYDGLIGVLVQAIKELKHKVDILENENR